MKSDGLQLSARSVVSLLARIYGPSFYDGPRFGRGDLIRHGLSDLVSGPRPEPWREVMLNPQPLPPRELHAHVLADAHIQEFLALDRIGTMMGGDVMQRTLDQSLRLVAEIDELCPRWPKWPKRFPPPPPPPWQLGENMTVTELFVFGSRFLAASEAAEQGKLRDALAGLGEKALGLSMRS